MFNRIVTIWMCIDHVSTLCVRGDKGVFIEKVLLYTGPLEMYMWIS